MALGLRQKLHRALGKVQLRGVNQHHGGMGGGGARHHIAGVLLVPGRVGNDEFAPGRCKVAVGHVDGDALLAFGFQPVC